MKWKPLKIERPRGNRWSRLSDGSSTSPDIFADPIERSAVRRYLEPLEFDCALHYDPGFARLHGYEDAVVPVSALSTFAMGPMWCPGERIFLSQDRNAPPARSAVSGIVTGLEPPTTGYFAAEYDVEYLRPAVVGDRLPLRTFRAPETAERLAKSAWPRPIGIHWVLDTRTAKKRPRRTGA